MSESVSSQSEDIGERLRKKFVRDELAVDICIKTDITDLALQKYKQLKRNYNFVSFEEAKKPKSVLTGTFESHVLPVHDFNEQMHRFNKLGYCANPDATAKSYVFSQKNKQLKDQVELEGEQIGERHPQFMQNLYEKTTSAARKAISKLNKAKRSKEGAVLDYIGPWAGYGEIMENGALTTEQKQLLQTAEERKRVRVEESIKEERNFEPYSTFHLKQYRDYKGQSYVDPPTHLQTSIQNCYLPKKQTQSWVASQKPGFQVVKFFPKSGHFLLVGNPQGKVHLYDINTTRTCAQTYVGHTKAVRDIQFSNDGKHFLSAGFDGQVQYWDTEYGKVHRTFKLKSIPFAVKFHPSSALQNVFFCGASSKKIYQFDLNTGTKTMEYNQHLGTVNTLTFIEEHKFVSSSDDKKLFVWEYGIPVVTRHVSEPEMHTITATALHPGGEFFAGQSSDNQIVIYENKGGNFRRIRSKKFASHFCAGYACGIDFSNDGQFLISGDERGKIFFYDWKTSKNYRIIDGHPGACIGVDWHPLNPKMVASCGWEGYVKLWE